MDGNRAAVSEEEFAARCAALNVGKRIALAVSGGRDSMALLRLAASYAPRAGAELIAFTVDHGLRAASAREAAQTAEWCAARGVGCEVLAWRGPKPGSGVQAAARAARYRLLAGAAAGADSLLTAHSADDQAETLFMRLSRGAAPRGLGAMEAEIRIAAGPGPVVRLLRPLLSFSRARLTATAKAFDQRFIDDPGNDDPAFERVRVRALLAALEENGLLTGAALVRTAARMRRAEARLRRAEASAFRSGGGCFYRWGGASLDVAAVRGGGAALAGLARRLIGAVGGAGHGPDEKGAETAVEGALATGAATLGGALLRIWRGRLWFLREPAALCGREGTSPLAPITLARGQSALWDGRFIVEIGPDAEGGALGALGTALPGVVEGPRWGLFTGPPEALAALPGLWRDGALIATPATPSIGARGVSFRALAEERFDGAIVRYP